MTGIRDWLARVTGRGRTQQQHPKSHGLLNVIGSPGTRFDRGVRFCVEGPDQRYSETWRVWGHRSEFYVGARSLLGSMKVSFHSSRISRIALLEDSVDGLRKRGLAIPEDRAITKWHRPVTKRTGAVHVMSVMFSTAHFNYNAQTGTPGKPTLIFQVPPNGCPTVEVAFYYTRVSGDDIYEKFAALGFAPVYTALENGEFVWMVTRPISRIWIPDVQTLARLEKSTPEDWTPEETGTGLFWNRPRRGKPFIIVEAGLRYRDGALSLAKELGSE